MTFIVTGNCPHCGLDLAVRNRKRDGERFVSCTGWPRCSFATDYDDALQSAVRKIREAAAPKGSEAVRKKLRDLVFKFHPDRNHQQKLSPHDVTVAINEVISSLNKP